MGVFYTWYYAAMAVLPGLAGMARDLAGSAAAPVLFSAAMMVVTLACLAGFVVVPRGKAAAALAQ
jgi:hypothetical protein